MLIGRNEAKRTENATSRDKCGIMLHTESNVPKSRDWKITASFSLPRAYRPPLPNVIDQ